MNPLAWRRNPFAPAGNPALLYALSGLATSLLSDSMGHVTGTIGLTPYHRL